MGKYPTSTIKTPEWAIANELAESNRLKRLELKYSGKFRPEFGNMRDLDNILEDKA